MWALEERVDHCPPSRSKRSRACSTCSPSGQLRVAALIIAVHQSGKVLIALYRTVESDRIAEDKILNLIDGYLASDLRDLGEEVRAYERHWNATGRPGHRLTCKRLS